MILGMFVLSFMFTSSTRAEFDKISISLEEGDTITVAYSTDRWIWFELEPLYPFDDYQNAIRIYPKELNENGDITIHLINLPQQETVTSDNYVFSLNAMDNENNLISSLIVYASIEGTITPEPTINPSILENLVTLEDYNAHKKLVINQLNEINVLLYGDDNSNASNAIVYEMYENLENLIIKNFNYQNSKTAEQAAVIDKQDKEISRLSSQLSIFIAIFVSLVVVATIGFTIKMVSRTKPEVKKPAMLGQIEDIKNKLKGKVVEEPEKPRRKRGRPKGKKHD